MGSGTCFSPSPPVADKQGMDTPENRADSAPPPVVLGGVPIARLDTTDALALMGGWLDSPGQRRAATANLDFLEMARGNLDLHRCLATADLVTADGKPLLWLARLHGAPIPERVAGADFTPLLVGEAARRGRSVFFLGGADGVAQAAAERLRETYPDLRIAGCASPMVRLDDEASCLAAADLVRESGADLLLVALGCPKQDLFLEQYLDATGARLGVGVGGTFNFIIGRVRRAPPWIQKVGLEWAFRFAMEPRRLFGRYLRDAIHLGRLAREALVFRSLSSAQLSRDERR